MIRFSSSRAPPPLLSSGASAAGESGQTQREEAPTHIAFGALIDPLVRGGAAVSPVIVRPLSRQHQSADTAATDEQQDGQTPSFSKAEIPVVRNSPPRCKKCGCIVWGKHEQRAQDKPATTATSATAFVDVQRTGTWSICAFCGDETGVVGDDANGTGLSGADLLEVMRSPVVDFVDPNGQSQRADGGAGYAVDQCLVLLLDATAGRNVMEQLSAGLLHALDSATISPTCRISVVAFSHAVFVYDLGAGLSPQIRGQPGADEEFFLVSAEALPPHAFSAQLDALLTHIDQFSVPLVQCRPRLRAILRAICECAPEDGGPSAPRTALEGERISVAGAALEIAVGLLDYDRYVRVGVPCPVLSGHVLALLSMAPNFGPGAFTGEPYSVATADLLSNGKANPVGSDDAELDELATFYSGLGRAARGAGTVVDLICAGSGPFHLHQLGELPRECGGLSVLLQDFADDSLVVTLGSALGRMVGAHGSAALATSRGLSVRNVFGPINLLVPSPKATRSLGLGDLVKMDFGGVSESCCICVEFERSPGAGANNPVSEAACVQFAVSFTNLLNERVLRVISASVSAAQTFAEYRESCLGDVCAVVTAKSLVADARLAGLGLNRQLAQRAESKPAAWDSLSSFQFRDWWKLLDATIASWMTSAGEEVGGGTALGDDEAWLTDHYDQVIRNLLDESRSDERKQGTAISLPENLHLIIRLLYSARGGPLFRSIWRGVDDADCIRRLFLQAPLEPCRIMLEPRVWILSVDSYNSWLATNTEEDGSLKVAGQPDADVGGLLPPFVELGPHTLALQSDKMVVMDHLTDAFIWSGALIAGSTYDAMREFALFQLRQSLLRSNRFPFPRILSFAEGDSMSRFLMCRLAPTHKDSPEEQLAAVPQLAELSQDERVALLEKFTRTDELSLVQFQRIQARGGTR